MDGKNKSVIIDVDKMKEGTCRMVDFGKGDKRVACKEDGKIKLFELFDDR